MMMGLDDNWLLDYYRLLDYDWLSNFVVGGCDFSEASDSVSEEIDSVGNRDTRLVDCLLDESSGIGEGQVSLMDS